MAGKTFVRRILSRPGKLGYFANRVGRALQSYANNYDFDINQNGERLLIEKLEVLKPEVILDVGANHGSWAALCAEHFPLAKIYAFEPVPSNYEQLVSRFQGHDRVSPQNIGLGDVDTSLLMETGGRKHSHARILTDRSDQTAVGTTIKIDVIRGDKFAAAHGISFIDVLKIDAEGFDVQVLTGFSELLRTRCVSAIQFEYSPLGYHYAMSLEDVYSFLQGHGYVVGRLYPEGVRFGASTKAIHTVFGVNYVAIRADHFDLVEQVKSPTWSESKVSRVA